MCYFCNNRRWIRAKGSDKIYARTAPSVPLSRVVLSTRLRLQRQIRRSCESNCRNRREEGERVRRFHDDSTTIRISRRSIINVRTIILNLISSADPFALPGESYNICTIDTRNRVYATRRYMPRNADDYIGHPVDRDILHRLSPLFSLPFVPGEGLTRTFVCTYVRPYIRPPRRRRGFYRWQRRSHGFMYVYMYSDRACI